MSAGPSRLDDFGDGVDALLSLATVAHNARAASSSMNEALPQASTTPAVTAMTDPSAAGGTADGTATEGDPMVVCREDEEAEGRMQRRARVGSELPMPPHLQAVTSPSKSKGGSMRGTPGGVSTGTAARASPRKAAAGKGGRAGRASSAKTAGEAGLVQCAGRRLIVRHAKSIACTGGMPLEGCQMTLSGHDGLTSTVTPVPALP